MIYETYLGLRSGFAYMAAAAILASGFTTSCPKSTKLQPLFLCKLNLAICPQTRPRSCQTSVKIPNRYGMTRSLSFFGTKSCRPILRRGAISTGKRFVSYASNECSSFALGWGYLLRLKNLKDDYFGTFIRLTEYNLSRAHQIAG